MVPGPRGRSQVLKYTDATEVVLPASPGEPDGNALFPELAGDWPEPYPRCMNPTAPDDPILQIERPHPDLWKYYLLTSLVILPLFPVVALVFWFRYSTLRYRFTHEGVSMRWGILFRREVIIQYARIQDIHLRSNIVERWLGLARVLVQTASGSASAEMTLEGLKEFEAVRDFLYSRMRGVQFDHAPAGAASSPGPAQRTAAGDAAVADALREVAQELRLIRDTLGTHGSKPAGGRDVR